MGKVVNLSKKSNEAPIPETIPEAIIVLKGLVSNLEDKIKKSEYTNPLAKNFIAKNMGLNEELLDVFIKSQNSEIIMEISALKLAITALEELEHN